MFFMCGVKMNYVFMLFVCLFFRCVYVVFSVSM